MNRVVEATMLEKKGHNNVDSGSDNGWILCINHLSKNLKTNLPSLEQGTKPYV